MWLLIKSDFYRYTRGKKWLGLLFVLVIISLTSIVSYLYTPTLLDAVSDTNDPAFDSQTIKESQAIRKEIKDGNVAIYLKATGGNTFLVVLLIVLVSVNFLVADFRTGIFKLSFSFGVSRRQLYLAKYFFGLLGITIILSFYHLTSLFISCIFFKIKEPFFYYLMRTFQVIIIQLPLVFAIFAVCMGLTYVVKKKFKVYSVIFLGAALLVPIQIKFAQYFPKLANIMDRFHVLSTIGKVGSWQNHSLDYFASNVFVFYIYSIVFLTIGWMSFKNYEFNT